MTTITFLNHAELKPALAILSVCDDVMLSNQAACVLLLMENELFFAAHEIKSMNQSEYEDFIDNNVETNDDDLLKAAIELVAFIRKQGCEALGDKDYEALIPLNQAIKRRTGVTK